MAILALSKVPAKYRIKKNNNNFNFKEIFLNVFVHNLHEYSEELVEFKMNANILVQTGIAFNK